MKIPKKIYLIAALILFLGGGATVLAFQPHAEEPKTVSIQQVSAIHPEEVAAVKTTTPAPVQQTSPPAEIPPTPPPATERVLFDMESGNTYAHNAFIPRALESPTIKPTGAWKFSYQYTCNPGAKILMYRLSDKGSPIANSTITNSDSPEGSSGAADMNLQWNPDWTGFHVLISEDPGCTWHIKATEPI